MNLLLLTISLLQAQASQETLAQMANCLLDHYCFGKSVGKWATPERYFPTLRDPFTLIERRILLIRNNRAELIGIGRNGIGDLALARVRCGAIQDSDGHWQIEQNAFCEEPDYFVGIARAFINAARLSKSEAAQFLPTDLTEAAKSQFEKVVEDIQFLDGVVQKRQLLYADSFELETKTEKGVTIIVQLRATPGGSNLERIPLSVKARITIAIQVKDVRPCIMSFEGIKD